MDLRSLSQTPAPALPPGVCSPAIVPPSVLKEHLAAESLAASSSILVKPLEQHLATPLAQGQSLNHLELVDHFIPDAQAQQPILPQDLNRAVGAYNALIKNGLEQAASDSALGQFSGTLKLMANLQDPRLQQDSQAWELLQLRRSQIEAAYAEQSQLPEVKAFFEHSRQTAMQANFGDTALRAQQQAAWINSPEFKAGLSLLPPAEAQAKIQDALSGLAMLDPQLASQTHESLTTDLLEQQALMSLQSLGPEGVQAREGFDRALSIYLKNQQSMIKISLANNQPSRLGQLSSAQIDELTHAVSGLAAGAQAKSPYELMQTLIHRVDELPPHLRSSATTLIHQLSRERLLGSVSFVGSLAGLMNQDVPTDPKAWLSTTSAALNTAGSAHHGLRLLGFHNAADLAHKINYQLPVGAVKVPMLGAVTTGLGIATESIGFFEELNNEDPVGIGTRAAGVGAGVASLAALTVISGPAAPVVLIGSTAVGLTAWGINSLYGESDLTGELRRQLRQSGISDYEEQLIHNIAPDQQAATLPERVALSNALLDRGTDASEDARIAQQLMNSSDVDFRAQLSQMHLPRLVRELEDSALMPVLLRAYQTDSDPASRSSLIENTLQMLQSQGRQGSIQQFISQLPHGSLQGLSTENLISQLESLNAGNLQEPARKELLETLLTRPDLSQQRQNLTEQTLLVQQWRSGLGVQQGAPLIKQLLVSQQPDQLQLAQALLSPPPPEAVRYLSPSDQGYSGQELMQRYAAYLSYMTLEALSPEQLEQLPEGIKRHLGQQLEFLPLRPDVNIQRLEQFKAALSS